jgi:hypothetical protein
VSGVKPIRSLRVAAQAAMASMAYDPRDKFCGGAPGEIVLFGVSPTDEEIVEAQARIAAGEAAAARVARPSVEGGLS